MAPFYGWGSTASRVEPHRGGSLLFTTNFPEISGTHFVDFGSMKDERLSRPWSHTVVLNTGPLDWESSALTISLNIPSYCVEGFNQALYGHPLLCLFWQHPLFWQYHPNEILNKHKNKCMEGSCLFVFGRLVFISNSFIYISRLSFELK